MKWGCTQQKRRIVEKEQCKTVQKVRIGVDESNELPERECGTNSAAIGRSLVAQALTRCPNIVLPPPRKTKQSWLSLQYDLQLAARALQRQRISAVISNFAKLTCFALAVLLPSPD